MKKHLLLIIVSILIAVSGYFFLNKKKSGVVFGNYEDEKFNSEAWDAMQFVSTAASYPYADIPGMGYAQAFQQYNSTFATNNLRTQSVAPWQSIGPNNLGGRTLCIAFDPADTSTIWLGSASGGLWKSTTGGIGQQAWTYVPTGFPVRGVSCISINHNNPNEMYIGTGEVHTHASAVNGLIERPTRGSVGIGILKSMDGGITWAPSLNWNYDQTRGIWDMVMNPNNTNEVYAATTEGIYQTTDGGATWNLVLNELMVMDLSMDPVNPLTVYAGVGNTNSPSHGIWRTTNGGANWTHLTNGLPPGTNQGRISLRINSVNHNTVYALIADLYSTIGLYRSYDAGNTWNFVNGTEIVSYQGWYAKGLWISTNDTSRLMFGGVQVFRSDDNGNNIFRVSNINFQTDYIHVDIHDIVANPLDPDMLYVLTDGGLYRSDDFGDSYYACTDGYITSQFYIGAVSATDPNLMLAGAQDNYTNRYNGTVYWDQVFGGDGSFCAINPDDDYIAYCSYQYLNIQRSDDRGFNWYDIFDHNSNSSGANTVAFIAPFVLCHSNLNVMYAASDTLYRSDDAGFTWYPQSGDIDAGNPGLSIAVSYTNTDSLYITTAPDVARPMHVLKSTDGGITLTDISGNLPNRFPRDIAVNPQNSSEVYVVFSGFGTGHIFKSTDAGSTWTDQTGILPDLPFHTIEILPAAPETLFVGSDLGVFASINGGASWYAFNMGLPEGVMVFDLRYSPYDNSLVAFTHGNGIYKVSLTDINTPVTPASFAQDFIQKIISNPVKNELLMVFNSSVNGTAHFLIYDAGGKCMSKNKNEIIAGGKNFINLDVSGLAQGVYFLNTELGNKIVATKFVVVK